jgi:hypothetical protein
MSPLVSAWFFSALAFSIAQVGWMLLTFWLQGGLPPAPIRVFRVGLVMLGLGLVVQLGYGGLLYFLLTLTGMWSLWTVTLAYLIPVILFSWAASDTTNDLIGTIPWLVFALIVAVVSWYFISYR